MINPSHNPNPSLIYDPNPSHYPSHKRSPNPAPNSNPYHIHRQLETSLKHASEQHRPSCSTRIDSRPRSPTAGLPRSSHQQGRCSLRTSCIDTSAGGIKRLDHVPSPCISFLDMSLLHLRSPTCLPPAPVALLRACQMGLCANRSGCSDVALEISTIIPRPKCGCGQKRYCSCVELRPSIPVACLCPCLLPISPPHMAWPP